MAVRLAFVLAAAATALLPLPARRPARVKLRALDEKAKLEAEIERLSLLKEVERLRAEVREDERAFAEENQRRAEQQAAEDAVAAAERATRAAADAAKDDERKRAKVLRLCRDANATRVGLILVNDNVNKRARVLEVLTGAGFSPGVAEEAMQRAHQRDYGLVATYAESDFAAGYDAYAKISDADLKVRFVAAPEEDDDDELFWSAFMQETEEDFKEMGIDLFKDDGELTGEGWALAVGVNVVVASFVVLGFTLAWTLGGELGNALGAAIFGDPNGF
mmetsp:Transcript_16518/g.49311  ORF Transcript_16518/g.49311 Transcript_16518/m.49311 type:complete len:277 (+) Transcript_16518:157-987(+)